MTDNKAAPSDVDPHSIGKSCLYVKRLDEVDSDVLGQLIAESYETMGSGETAL